MAGFWHPVASSESGGEPLQANKDGDLPKSGIPDVALILGDPVIPRVNERTAVTAIWASRTNCRFTQSIFRCSTTLPWSRPGRG